MSRISKYFASIAVAMFAGAGMQAALADTYIYNFDNHKDVGHINSVATLQISDIAGGAAFTFTGTFADLTSSAFISELGFDGPSGTAGAITGKAPESGPKLGSIGGPVNTDWVVFWPTAGKDGGALRFKTGDTTSWEITGSGVTAASFELPMGLHLQGLTGNEWAGTSQNSAWIYATVAAVPEPGTSALLLAGLGMIGFMTRRRTRQPS